MEKENLIALVRAAQQGDSEATTKLYMAFHQDLYYHISKTVNDPALAEDLLQDTFIEIFQTIDRLQEPAAFVTWSKQIAYHRCTAYFRKRRELLADEDEDGYSIFDTIEEDRAEFIPDEALDQEDFKQTIHAMINELPPEQRSALLMRYFDEISVKEIAEIQGVSEGTVKSRLNYARKSIQKSVEDYEKKSGVKLRCVGIIPLLLWLFAQKAGTASATTATTAPVVAQGAKAGAKAAGKFAIKKLLAGIAAVAVAVGGIATAAILKDEPEQPPEQPPMVWCGYGSEASSLYTHRYELVLDVLDDTTISGHLEASSLYDIKYETDFSGNGVEADGIIVYTIQYDKIWSFGAGYSYKEMELVYDKAADTFSLNEIFHVTMERASLEPSPVVMENLQWSGMGKDGFYNSYKRDHLYEIHIYQMTENAVSGTFRLSYQDQEDHLSEFTGRGYKKEGIYYFEVTLETPRPGKDEPISFWLKYDTKKETLSVSGFIKYNATLEPEK